MKLTRLDDGRLVDLDRVPEDAIRDPGETHARLKALGVITDKHSDRLDEYQNKIVDHEIIFDRIHERVYALEGQVKKIGEEIADELPHKLAETIRGMKARLGALEDRLSVPTNFANVTSPASLVCDAELAALRKDRERLEWMMKAGVSTWNREEVDEAMKKRP